MLLIAGMRGNHCRDRIVAALESTAGVKAVDVNLYRARATTIHDPSCAAVELIQAVLGAGYSASLVRDALGVEWPEGRGD